MITKLRNVILKLTLNIVLPTIFLLTSSYAQSRENEEVTLVLEHVTLKEVFTEIEQQTAFVFSFENKWVESKKKIDVNYNSAKVSTVLNDLSNKFAFAFKIEDEFISIFNRSSSESYSKVQQQQVTGTVFDEFDEPLPGATVLVKGTNKGTITDFDGNFTIDAAPGNTLSVSFIGYRTVEVAVESLEKLSVALQSEVSVLDETVVVGYGRQKKATITGSVASIKSEEIVESQTANISNNLAGRVAGLVINNRGGEPGNDQVDILIRGLATTRDNSPLIVIDGVQTRGSFERLNPEDIESVSVLKDASAAIYGASGANGVILITTKRGKENTSILSYSHSYSMAQPTRRPYLMNAVQYLTWSDELKVRAGRPPEFQQEIKDYQNGTNNPIKWADTDWWRETTDTWTPEVQHKLSLTGGGESTRYFISGQYLDQDAIYVGNAYGYKQYNTRSNLDLNVTDKLKIGLDVAGRVGDKVSPLASTDQLIRQIFVQPPYELGRYENGLLAKTSSGNPTSQIDGSNGYNNTSDRRVDSKLSFDLDLEDVLDGLSLSGYTTFDYYSESKKQLSKPFDQYFYDEKTNEYTNHRDETGTINLFQETKNQTNKTYLVRLNYAKQFDDHRLDAFVAYEQYTGEGEKLSASRFNLVTERLPYLFTGEDAGKNNFGDGFKAARKNYLARLNYNFKGKYLVEFVMRYDGSSKFPKHKRFGFFPGASLGWRISDENFFTSENITNLKARFSFGKLGNDLVDDFQYLQIYTIEDGHVFGKNKTQTKGLYPGTTPNENITWESSLKYNFGLDFNFKGQELAAILDVFYERRSDILTPRNQSVPLFTGFQLPDENIGIVNNRGIELQLNHNKRISQDFSYSIGSQATYAKSKIEFIDEAKNVPAWQRKTGSPVDVIKVYQANGIYNNQAEIDNSVSYSGARPGDIRFVDQNGDGEITDQDQILLEYSPTPKLTYGFSLGLQWKRFGLNMFFQGQAMVQSLYRPWDLNQQSYYFENRWISEFDTPNAKFPGAFTPADRSFTNISTVWLRNNEFLKLKNIELSYLMDNEKLLNQIGIESVRLSISGHNLFFIYDMVDINDPESSSQTGWYYPQQRLITAGLNFTLKDFKK